MRAMANVSAAQAVVKLLTNLVRDEVAPGRRILRKRTEHLLPDKVAELASGEVFQVDSFLQGLGGTKERKHVLLSYHSFSKRLVSGQNLVLDRVLEFS